MREQHVGGPFCFVGPPFSVLPLGFFTVSFEESMAGRGAFRSAASTTSSEVALASFSFDREMSSLDGYLSVPVPLTIVSFDSAWLVFAGLFAGTG